MTTSPALLALMPQLAELAASGQALEIRLILNGAVAQLSIRPAAVALPTALADLPPRDHGPWHAPDFQMVVWDGGRYYFSHKQRLVIKRLWEAWESGRPEVDQATLLRAANSECLRCSICSGVIRPGGR